MPDVREHFPDIELMDVGALYEKRAEIIARAPGGNTNHLDDDSLAELLQIGRTLRRKAASSSGVGRAKKSPKAETTLDDLA
jgi:hypothetical protein